MAVNYQAGAPHEEETPRPVIQSMVRGFRKKCPACGEGQIFNSYLKSVDECRSCKEELHHHRADDLPAYLNILITGHIIGALIVVVMKFQLMSNTSLMILSLVVTLSLTFLLISRLKGMVIGSQWALRMHGFGGEEDWSPAHKQGRKWR